MSISPHLHRTIYLSGPITGRPRLNRPAFGAAAARLRAAGFAVVSPHELGLLPSTPWEQCMRRCLAELVRCDAVVVLRGWWASRGASWEVQTARLLQMPVVDAERMADVRTPAALEGGI